MTTLQRYEIVFYRPPSDLLPLPELAAGADVHPGLVERFIQCGLIEPRARQGDILYFDASAVPRLRMIKRLRDELGINLAGIAVILDLRDRMRALQRENEAYRQRF
jgi:MerR family transcriptional regulator/heat shock protein HspR